MEDVAISDWPTDWPGQALDINGSNPWLPAYGFQAPSALLEKDDFIGNPDAEYFLQSGYSSHYMYLEPIQEETSDDLQSESDLSETRTSPVGWLATDSEAGSVICITKEILDYESDREAACPAKRRKQDHNFLTINNAEEDLHSLSRSSSLLQFETLEKQCQETCSSSPSIYSQFSFDSLDVQRKSNVSPDSLDRVQSDGEQESDYYKALKIDVPRKKDKKAFFNATKAFGGSDSSDTSSGTSEGTLDGGGSRSLENLRDWRSFDSLPTLTLTSSTKTKDEVSVENLSEDSGYSDHSSNSKYKTTMTSLSEADIKSVNFDVSGQNTLKPLKFKTATVDFNAYDGEGFSSFSGNFGTSYQDLSVFDKYGVLENHRSPLIDRFMRRRGPVQTNVTNNINIEESQECGLVSKYNCTSSSEPNLPAVSVSFSQSSEKLSVNTPKKNCSFPLDNSANSVPKDLNLVDSAENSWCNTESVAAKNFDLANLTIQQEQSESYTYCSSNLSELLSVDMSFRREGSYAEAMSNRVDLSDDENSLIPKPTLKRPKTSTIETFDKKVLKAISEQSIQSINSRTNLYEPELYTQSPLIQNRCFTSTPNVSTSCNQNFEQSDEHTRSTQDVRRKSSIKRKNGSTSTSGISDLDEKTVTSTKSLTESTKGVHFSPLVDEVVTNWHDESTETERESSYSPRSSSPESETTPTPVEAHNSEPERISRSQPDLNDERKEFLESLKSFQMELTKSQPDMSDKMKRRGSQILKKDKDGCLIKAYIDGDGIQYKHTHLDLKHVYNTHNHKTPTTVSTSTDHVGSGSFNNNNTESTSTMQRQQVSISVPVVGSMAEKTQRDAGSRKDKGKIGGFFSRLASFRFSNAKKKNANTNQPPPTSNHDVSKITPQIRQATKDDYIYIPLKGPVENNNAKNNSFGDEKVSGKPPVPRAPPKIVGASVKKEGGSGGLGNHHQHRQGGGATEIQERRRRRTTIDSGSRPRPMEPMGLIETDLDTEVTVITDGADVKTRSLLNLGTTPAARTTTVGLHLTTTQSRETHRPHKSMEFLLDKENIKVVEPPENELQKGERVMSEHQLRVQRSLQKLTIPEWYKQSQIPQEGFLLRKHHNRENRWTGTGSRTTSLSSLGSSPVMLSPTPHSQPFVRWSTSKLNSTASSPCASTRSSFNTRQANGSLSPSSVRSSFSYRQPYLGWRSQERLNKPRTPAERLANSLLSNQSHQINQNNQIPNRDIQTSIKEVTSAIVHYVSGLKPENNTNYDSQDTTSQKSSSISPRGSQKLCWLESSFVGTRPLDSPQTPVALSECSNATTVNSPNLRLELRNHNDMTLKPSVGIKPSPSSTTLEDVLDSLLGLPSSARAPSPSLQGRRHVDGVS